MNVRSVVSCAALAFLIAPKLSFAENAATNGVASVTNYVVAHPDFREVDGKLYNRARSKLWKHITGTVQIETQGGLFMVGITDSAFNDAVQYKGDRNSIEFRLVQAWLLSGPKDMNGTTPFFLKNYPGHPLTGDKIDCLALPVGRTNINSETLAVYDFGKPHIVAVPR
jgi:hypothetical protein